MLFKFCKKVRSGFAVPFCVENILLLFHVETKETKLERADFTLQLLMFVTAEKE